MNNKRREITELRTSKIAFVVEKGTQYSLLQSARGAARVLAEAEGGARMLDADTGRTIASSGLESPDDVPTRPIRARAILETAPTVEMPRQFRPRDRKHNE